MDYLQQMMQHSLIGDQRERGYLARAEIERLVSRLQSDPKRLEPFGFKVYSQGDEDGILEEIFRRLNISRGTFCEIGVENGLECNSLYLIHKDWRGFWVEGNVNHKTSIEEKFGYILKNQRLRLVSEMVTIDNINQILSLPGLHAELDFLSIDVDGNDLHIMKALQSRPKVVCIEYNAKFPGALHKVQTYSPTHAWQGTDYSGSSLAAIDAVANAMGYRLVGTNLVGVNAFFVRSDLTHSQFPDDSSPAYLYNPPRYWLVYDHYAKIGHPADFGPYEDLIGP